MTAEQLALWRAVIERDSWTCIECGMVGSQVHHIFPRWRKGAWALTNMCVLCVDCHRRAHSKRARGILLREMTRRYGYTYTGQARWYAEEC